MIDEMGRYRPDQEGNKILFVIPTISRLVSLERTVKSIKNQGWKNAEIVVVVDDGRWDYFREVGNALGRSRKLKILINPKRLGWCRTMNMVFKDFDSDYYFYGSDDLEFEFDTIIKAMSRMEKHFPDGDGVVGFQQNLKHFCPAAFGIFGRKWKKRFPEDQVFFPNYKHFCGDSELWHFSQSIGKFHFCKSARVFHHRAQDPCHRLAQSTLRRDREIWWQKKGHPEKYWGKSFKLNPPF